MFAGQVNHGRPRSYEIDSARHRAGRDAHGDLVTIDYEGADPLWQQLAVILRAAIESGEYPSGRALPSETTLMQRYGLARGTVRHAIDSLVKDGLVRRVQGRGTFVL